MPFKFNPFTGKLDEFGPVLTGTGTVSAAADGTAASPGIAFASDLNTGIYRPGADQLAISTNGTERLRITSDGKLGLGTSSPAQLLDVRGTGTVAHIGNTDEYTQLGTFGAGTSERPFLRLTDGSGSWQSQIGGKASDGTTTSTYFLSNVGIGATAPDSKLTIQRSLGQSPSQGGITFKDESGTTTSAIGIDGASSNELRLMAGSGDVIAFHTNSDLATTNERARIDSSGRLLVGTSSWSGSNLVTIQGNTSSSTGGGELFLSRGASAGTILDNDLISRISFGDKDDNDYARIECMADGSTASGDYPGRLVFSTTADGASSPTERMRIDSSGSVTIFGQDNQLVLNRSGHSNWNFSNGSAGLVLHQDLQDGNGPKRRLIISPESTPSFGIQFFNTSEVETLRVEEDGDVLNSNNSYGSLSDLKLKENIVDASSQWNDLKALQVRKYNFKPETSYSTHTQIGLIAQEVELVSPGLVSETPDTDEEGNDLGTVTKSVNYSVLYMKAVKALQEAMERIEVLEAKVNALEGN